MKESSDTSKDIPKDNGDSPKKMSTVLRKAVEEFGGIERVHTLAKEWREKGGQLKMAAKRRDASLQAEKALACKIKLYRGGHICEHVRILMRARSRYNRLGETLMAQMISSLITTHVIRNREKQCKEMNERFEEYEREMRRADSLEKRITSEQKNKKGIETNISLK